MATTSGMSVAVNNFGAEWLVGGNIFIMQRFDGLP